MNIQIGLFTYSITWMKIDVSRLSEKDSFNRLVRLITEKKYFSMINGFDKKGQAYEIFLWLAGDDVEQEGKFVDFYTKQPILGLPWLPNRPYKGATNHNYLQAYIAIRGNRSNDTIVNAGVQDEREIDNFVN